MKIQFCKSIKLKTRYLTVALWIPRPKWMRKQSFRFYVGRTGIIIQAGPFYFNVSEFPY